MRPNNRQRSRGGRNGGGGSGGGGGGGHHKQQQQHHNPNRPPNRNQIFDSSGPDVRVRGNAHQVFDKYQALAREAASSGDRIMAEAYWQYADHYFRMIQTQGGFVQRNNTGWGDDEGQPNPQQQGQGGQAPQANGSAPNGSAANGEGQGQGGERQSNDRQSDDRQGNERQGGERQSNDRQSDDRRGDDRQGGERQSNDRQSDDRQGGERQANDRQSNERQSNERQSGERQGGERQSSERQSNERQGSGRGRQVSRAEPASYEDQGESEPGLGGVAFLQNGRTTPAGDDPAADEQPDVPDFTPAPATGGRRR